MRSIDSRGDERVGEVSGVSKGCIVARMDFNNAIWRFGCLCLCLCLYRRHRFETAQGGQVVGGISNGVANVKVPQPGQKTLNDKWSLHLRGHVSHGTQSEGREVRARPGWPGLEYQ